MEPQLSQDILNKTIQIKSVEMTKTQTGKTMFKLTDQDGIHFIFFKTKNDGANTAVFDQYKQMGLDEGFSATIGYVVDNYELKGKKLFSNKIINFMEAREEVNEPKEELRKENIPADHQNNTKNDTYGKRLALHGFVNGLLATGKTPDEITLTMLASLLELETRIDQALQNEITTEDIPF